MGTNDTVSTINLPSTSLPSTSLPTLSAAQLAERLGRSDAPVLWDVRRPERFAQSERILCGAVRELGHQDQNRDVVVYCVHGHEVSAQATQALLAQGRDAKQLIGGIEAAIQSTQLPSIRKRTDWGVDGRGGSQWITRSRPKIDRIACPWLIKRFIDPGAQFHYVPTAQVISEANKLGAIAYDIPAAPVTHQGELCSFDALLLGFDLRWPALDVLAKVVRGADTDRLELAAQSAGLLAFSLGLSRLHSEDDHAMLSAALPLYDALYAWCVDTVASKAEAHSWTPQ